MSLPQRRQTRSDRVRPVVPSVSRRWPMREGLPQDGQTTCTLLTCTGASWVTMPPDWAPRWVVVTRVCFLIRLTPSTRTRLCAGSAAMTFPLKPRSLPLMTWTVSPLRTNRPAISEHLRCQRNDLHEPLVPQLAADRTEDAGTARVAALADENRRVLVESNVGAVGAAALLRGADHHGANDVTALDPGTGQGVLDRGDDDVAYPSVTSRAASEHADAQDLLGTRVVGAAQSRLLLDHASLSPRSPV